MSKPRLALGSALIALVVAVAGCGTGEVAEKVSGFEIQHIEKVYAPNFSCSEVKAQIGGFDNPGHKTYSVTCLPRSKFLVKMARACRANKNDVGEEFWGAIDGKVGYIRCTDLEEAFENASMKELLEEVRDHQAEYENGERKLPEGP